MKHGNEKEAKTLQWERITLSQSYGTSEKAKTRKKRNITHDMAITVRKAEHSQRTSRKGKTLAEERSKKWKY